MNRLHAAKRVSIASAVLFVAATAEGIFALAVVPTPPEESRFAHARPVMVVQTMSPLPDEIIAPAPPPPETSIVVEPAEEKHGCQDFQDYASMANLPPRCLAKPDCPTPGGSK